MVKDMMMELLWDTCIRSSELWARCDKIGNNTNMGQDASMWHDMTGDKDVGQQDEACLYDADIMIRHCGKDITGTSACWYIVHLIAHLITHTHHTLIAHFAHFACLQARKGQDGGRMACRY